MKYDLPKSITCCSLGKSHSQADGLAEKKYDMVNKLQHRLA